MKQAVVLAAGEGQRLRPFTVNRPKGMIAIAGKPILGYVIEALAENGIRRIVVVVGYKKEQIYDYLESGERFGVEITFVVQPRQLGSAHALLMACDLADPEFLVLSGDNLIQADAIAKLAAATPHTVLVQRVADPQRYGVVALTGGRVAGVTEKPHDAASNAVSMGIYAFNRDVFSFIESTRLTVPDVLNGMIEAGVPVQALETQADWRNVVYPWDILHLNDAILRHLPGKSSGVVETNVTINGAVSLGKDTVVRSHSYLMGPLVIGDGCEIGPNVCLFPATSIADNVVIGAGSVLSNSVIGDDVNIGPGCIIQDSVIDRNTVIGARFTAASGDADVSVDGEYHRVALGTMLGEGCTLGAGVTAQPGTVAGNYSKVRAHKLISGRLPDGSVFI